ncbi:MAG: hypothetical protein BGO98_29455 [Myxococcales bacterium 68-20]|nr:MAG: hypothetical protein BGO98_29455 [Myxococcales bacterium 68-20]
MNLPQTINAEIRDAIDILAKNLQCASDAAATHEIVLVTGWSQDAATINAIGVYLVGLLTSSIATTLQVRSSIESTDEDRLEILENVKDLSARNKVDERNPWIAEGLWHLCLFLSKRVRSIHPTGAVLALEQPHIGAKDHGFDVVALYETKNGDVGVSVVECKAYENDPNGAINSAVEFFRAFDQGKYHPRMRQVVAQMRDLLPKAKQPMVSRSLWKKHRCYVPNPHYDAKHAMDWTNHRRSFKNLSFPVVVMPHAVPKFDKFFDNVMKAMLKFAKELQSV